MFQSTPACERATGQVNLCMQIKAFQSTPACERATATVAILPSVVYVSIHARV